MSTCQQAFFVPSKKRLCIFLYISFSRLDNVLPFALILNFLDSRSIGVPMYSCSCVYVLMLYSTSICNLFLFHITECYTCIVFTCCTKVCDFILFSVVEPFQSFGILKKIRKSCNTGNHVTLNNCGISVK